MLRSVDQNRRYLFPRQVMTENKHIEKRLKSRVPTARPNNVNACRPDFPDCPKTWRPRRMGHVGVYNGSKFAHPQ